MRAAADYLNNAVWVIEDAQEDIRKTVKEGFFNRDSLFKIKGNVNKIINKAVANIKIVNLVKDSKISLLKFAEKQYLMWSNLGYRFTLMELGLLAILASKNYSDYAIINKLNNSPSFKGGGNVPTKDKGVPLGKFYKDVWEMLVKPTLDSIAKDKAKNPNSANARNSLRNLAEMEVRYNEHLESINNLRNSGVKLVVASAHADCSDRCAKWQGRIYSLDGTYGEVDGHKYVPLEEATDVFVTTNSGRVYKNGLLGFNCRHRISPYKGQIPKTISEKERMAEYEITKKQRALELAIRNAKAEAQTVKGIDDETFKKESAAANRLYMAYVDFSKKHNRAYYPMRTKI